MGHSPRSCCILAILIFTRVLVAQEKIDFARDVQPLLAERCVRCHGPKRQEGGLRLDIRRRALVGGDTGPAIVGNSADKSELLLRLTHKADDKRMPPGDRPLDMKQIAILRGWIEQGAKWPDEMAGKESFDEHWAFGRIQRPASPTVKNKDRVRNAIDAFVLAGLEAKGLTFSQEAERRTLVRRLYLDLVGLPPTPAEIEAFLQDKKEDAYERLVDRLLASPHFGERWGRHWLDVARYAESDGYENDKLRKEAWRFRDWVIEAYNRDLPFDQFTIEQLAGDLLKDPTTEQKIAAGFHRNTLWNSAASADKEEFRTFAIKDRTDTTGLAWMGLTLGCAKCHSHKYDPVSQREYYQLYAFFNTTENDDVAIPGGRIHTLKSVKRATFVHKRGNFLQRGAEVTPATPAFLPPLQTEGAVPTRLDLARWLVSPSHPLTARVTADRTWQHLFGQGLVPTPENFGTNGEKPTHPELLDWLASEFVRLKWSQKALIKTIVMSATYRQASVHRNDLQRIDPDNRLRGRQNRFRVDAEIVRDQALAVSGLLDRKRGGPSVVPPFPDGLNAGMFASEEIKLPTSDHYRRGVYIHAQRTLTYPTLAIFDGVDGNSSCVRRARSITPIQALTLLNDPVFAECARSFGGRICKAKSQREERLKWAFEVCLARQPDAEELQILVDLVQTMEKRKAKEETVWAGVARTLLNLDEFVTRE